MKLKLSLNNGKKNMSKIKFRDISPPFDTLQIDKDIQTPIPSRSLYTRTAMKMKVGDSVGGLNLSQRSSLTQSLTTLYGDKNSKVFISRMENGKIPIGNNGTYRVWRIK